MAKSVPECLDIEAELKKLREMIPDIMNKNLDDPAVIDFQNKVLALKSRSTSSLEERKSRLNNLTNIRNHHFLFN